jgi:hypothetical protein
LAFNSTKAWKEHLHRTFDSDSLLASLSATARSLLHCISEKDLVATLLAVVIPPRRSATQLLAEGYCRVLSKDDPFTVEELKAVEAALARWVVECARQPPRPSCTCAL